MNEEKLDQDIAKGNEAKALLANQLLQETLALMKKEVIDKWAACPARDIKGREWLWQFYQNTIKFEEKLTETLNTGKMAFQEKKLSMADRAMNFVRRVA